MDVEKIREDFGYKGKPKQWQSGFDALLKHVADYELGYKGKLIALCEGLGLEEIDELLTKPSENLKAIGEIITHVIKPAPSN